MSQEHPIAVLAGTPIDTRMGVAVLAKAGLAACPFPLAKDPRQQTAFQISPAAEKRARVLQVLEAAKAQGCRRVFVYCNSLSSAVSFDPLAEQTGMRIVTPLEVYRSLPERYHRLGLIAANAQGLAGIERTLYAVDPELELLGACLLPAVFSIEEGVAPERLVDMHRLDQLAGWFEDSGMEALLLGCTHFPYFKEALAARTRLPLIDPAEEMVRRIQA